MTDNSILNNPGVGSLRDKSFVQSLHIQELEHTSESSMHLSALLRSGLSACTSSYSWCSWTQKSHEKGLPFANHHKSQTPFWCGGWGPFEYNCSMFLPTKISAISDLPKCVKILLCSPSSHHLIHVSFIPKASKPLRMNSKTVLKFSGDGASNRITESQTCKSASPNHSQPWKIVWNGISASEDPHKSSYKLLRSISDPTLEFSSSCWTASGIFIRPCEEWLLSRYNNYCRERKYIPQSWENSREGAQQN